MLRLYYAPDNASLIVRIALEEVKVPYETVLVDRAAKEQKSRAYLQINPVGQIPALLTPAGALSETGACLLWLCDMFPGRGLGPAADSSARLPFLKWLFYISNTVHANCIRLFYPERYVSKSEEGNHFKITTDMLKRDFSLLNDAALEVPSAFAPPSALTIYTAALLRWSVLYPLNAPRWLWIQDYPALCALIKQMETRPAVIASAEQEGLGPSPFSDPAPPTPPEGSPL